MLPVACSSYKVYILHNGTIWSRIKDDVMFRHILQLAAQGRSLLSTIIIIIINLLWRHSTGDQQRLTYVETDGKK